MIRSKIKAVLRPLKNAIYPPPERFLKKVTGVIHVGANFGQERELYHSHDLSVIWIEPIPEVYKKLVSNITGFKKQIAFEALVTDDDDKEYNFNIANNNGASSSILQMKLHKDIWPEVEYMDKLNLKSITLATLINRENIDKSKYQALIIDTQGSELLVLRGSIPVLNQFKFIKVEVPDFESYDNCCQLSDIEGFMIKHGYVEFYRHKFASRKEGGNYFDIVYKKKRKFHP